MGGTGNCSVLNCKNSTKKISKWKKDICEKHGEPHEKCPCVQPYQLYCFPSIKRNQEHRKKWIEALRRINADKSTWEPTDSSRVCGKHFVDGIPNYENPYPTLELGYEVKGSTPRREIVRHPPTPLKRRNILQEGASNTAFSSFNEPPVDHAAYSLPPNKPPCLACKDKDELVKSLQKRIASLKLKNSKQKQPLFNWKKIKTDQKMNFYTGFSSISLFSAVFTLIAPYLPNLQYWRGQKKFILKSNRRRKFVRSSRKTLYYKDEFLLTLMRLRLGLLNEDLADRFGISPTVCSNTFSTWIRLLRTVLGDALVKWIPIEAIKENMPKVFQDMGHSKVRCIIDCTEIFTERMKSVFLQASTWSDYKHHNTLKFLIGISPSGFITFISDCYGGRTSDVFICKDSGFYDLLERGDEIMADRGFQIKEELLLRFCSFYVPPGARAKSQMTSSECKRTKNVANLRIHVERAINRIKTYRILKTTLQVTMIKHADDIVCTCAALCNLKPLLIKTKL